MKLSQDIEKVTIPGKKEAFRLYGGDGEGVHFALSIWLGGGGGAGKGDVNFLLPSLP